MKSIQVQEKIYHGISNPSGAVALNDELMMVADDEDNILRIYNKNGLDKPVQAIKLSAVFKGKIADGEDLEIDIESATEIDGTYFWIGSHSTSRTGEFRSARHRLLAMTIKPGAKGKFSVSPVGEIYTSLIDDLNKDKRFDRYELGKAQKKPAKAIRALSIEGLAATAKGGLLIGFRNPLIGGKIKKDKLVKGKALVVEMLNPFEVIQGQEPKFADPLELDLNGLGIREITRRKKQKYLIVAGPYFQKSTTAPTKDEETRFYQWSTKSGKIKAIKTDTLVDLNIEAAIFYPGNDDCVQLLSDDGSRLNNTNGFRSLELVL